MSARVAAYTAIFGARDPFNEPPGDFEFVLFTDKPPERTRATVVRCPPPVPGDPVRSARKVKLLPHVFMPEREVTLWVDGAYRFKTADLDALAEKHLQGSDFATFRHPWNTCAYKEGADCSRGGKDDPDVIRRQLERYRSLGFPANAGLAATGALLRRRTAAVEDLCDAWWEEVFRWSRRDQVSFDFVCWVRGFKYSLLDGDCYDNPYFLHVRKEDERRNRRGPDRKE